MSAIATVSYRSVHGTYVLVVGAGRASRGTRS